MSEKSVSSFDKFVVPAAKEWSVPPESQMHPQQYVSSYGTANKEKTFMEGPKRSDSKMEKDQSDACVVFPTDAHEISNFLARIDMPSEIDNLSGSLGRQLSLHAFISSSSVRSSINASVPNYRIEQLDGASSDNISPGHEDSVDDPDLNDIEQSNQASLERLNRGHDNAEKEPQSGDVEQPNPKPSEDSSSQRPKDVQSSPESNDGLDAIHCLYTHDDPELYDIKQHDGDQEQEQEQEQKKASSAIEIIEKEKAVSEENLEKLPPLEDPKNTTTPTSEDLQDFIEVMNDGPVESPLEDLNQLAISTEERPKKTLEEADVSNMKPSTKDLQKPPQEPSDCEEGEVLTDDNDDDLSFNRGKGNIRHSTPFSKENNYQMFEKKQLPMPKPRGSGNFLMGLKPHMPYLLMPGMHQPDVDPFYSQPRAHVRIGPLLPTPLFLKSMPFDLAEANSRKELVTRKTTETVGTPISWLSVGGDTSSFSPTKEPELSSSKKSTSDGSSPITRKRTRSPPITLKRSRSRCSSRSVSPPRYGSSKRRRCRSPSRERIMPHRSTRRTVTPSPSPSPSRSPQPSPGRRVNYRTAVSPCPRNRYHSRSPFARRSPSMRHRSRSPLLRRRSRSPFERRRSPSRSERHRSRSPPIRHRLANASKHSRGPKLMTYAAGEPRLRNSSPMEARKRKISSSSSGSYDATDDTSSTDSSSKRRPTSKSGPKTPIGSPQARKKFLQLELLRLNEKIEKAKKMRQMKLMKLSAKADPRYRI